MSNKTISINNISLSVNNKTCFENFSTQIHSKKHIVIIGANGSGKSTLLKIIQGELEPTAGRVNIPADIVFGYVPQTVTEYQELSGGQRFNKSLSKALSLKPDILCLDEPTNHLDLANKRSLVRCFQRYDGTLIIVSHDPEILKLNFDEIWHIEHGKINVFTGNYTEYLKELELGKVAVQREQEKLRKERRDLNKLVQKESKRASQSRAINKNENDKNLLGAMKESGSQSAGKNIKRLSKAQDEVQQKLGSIFVHKKIEPKFNIDMRKMSSNRSVVSVIDGSCGYKSGLVHPILKDINLQLQAGDKMAIVGDNGTGKSTLIKAIMGDPAVFVLGEWTMPAKDGIGYLDQHYSILDPNLTVAENIQKLVPKWSNQEVRKLLNDFLFSAQEEVVNKVANLSGGEKARLSLAQIAARGPSLLLLDEITNNIDIETREHVIEVIKAYPGAIIIVTHDPEFLRELAISTVYETKNGTLASV